MTLSMLKSFSHRAGRAAILLAAFAVPATAVLAQSYPAPIAEDASAKLARNLRILGSSPRDFSALIAAGQASLELGDTQAAAGFFGRAEEVNSRSFLPQAGMGAAMVLMGEAAGALSYFNNAQRLGASQAAIGTDRGLAYDLLGDQARAQLDYRAALFGPNRDEARRRLALSLAISRDIKGAAATIEPLLVRRDPQAVRMNAFVLALAGDREGARRTIDAAMPGAGARFEPFFRMLPVLRPAEKAAAVHLGEFPKDAAQRFAQAQPIASSPVISIGNSAPPRQTVVAQRTPQRPQPQPVKVAEAPRRAVKEAPKPSTYLSMVRPSLDPSRYASTRRPKTQPPVQPKPRAADEPEPRPAGRLDDIAQLLSEPQPAAAAPVVQMASAEIAPPAPEPQLEIDLPPEPEPIAEPVQPPARDKAAEARKAAEAKKRADKLAAEKKAKAEAARLGVAGTNWVQLAGGSNQDRMGAEYRKLAAKAGSLLKSRAGYVTEGKDYFRLLVGPFPSRAEAQTFINNLEKQGVDGFSWTRTPAQIKIEKLKTR